MAPRRKSNLHLFSRLKFLSPRHRLEWYPPFWLMRVKVLSLPEDMNQVRIKLPLNWISANAAGNMFGGYQASLADPIPAIACLRLFPGYRVATKKLEMEFLRVGNSDLTLHFDFSADLQADIRQQLESNQRADPSFKMVFIREDGKVCTRICNTVAIRPKGYVSSLEGAEEDES